MLYNRFNIFSLYIIRNVLQNTKIKIKFLYKNNKKKLVINQSKVKAINVKTIIKLNIINTNKMVN